MGCLLNDKKHIEIKDNKDENKIKPKTYEKIRDVVLGNNENIIIEKNNTIQNNIILYHDKLVLTEVDV